MSLERATATLNGGFLSVLHVRSNELFFRCADLLPTCFGLCRFASMSTVCA